MEKARKDVSRIIIIILNEAKQTRCEIKERWEESKQGRMEEEMKIEGGERRQE